MELTAPLTPAARRAAVRAGARAALSPFALVLMVSFLGIGALAHEVGLPLAPTLASTLIVWAAPGQAILFAGLAAGSGPWPLALAIGVAGVRLLPMSVTILPLLRDPARPGTRAIDFLLSHFVAVTVWLEGTRRLPGMAAEERRPWFLAFSAGLVSLSVLATGIGYALTKSVTASFAAGLLLVSPLYFLASGLAGAKERGELGAFVVGGLTAPVAAGLGAGDFDLLLAGGLGAAVGWGLDRARVRA